MNRYLTAILVALSATAQAQLAHPAPKLVVNIVIDQLRTDYIDTYASLYTPNGLRKVYQQGCVYDAANYAFSPIDQASAIAAIATGTSPYYNNITGTKWLDRKTLRTASSVDDVRYVTAPSRMSVSTIGDELKIATNGAGIVYSIAATREAAVLGAGHAADGAFWMDERKGDFLTSSYYPEKARTWISNYKRAVTQSTNKESLTNASIINLCKECITANAMGRDDIPDLLFMTLSARNQDPAGSRTQMESLYMQIDNMLGEFITHVESAIGKGRVLFVITSTGYADEPQIDYSKYKIPTGTFYINRTANLLNIYLGAIYGQGRYIESCFRNEIYFNHKLIEQKRISFSDILSRSQEFLIQNAGVKDVLTSTRILGGDGSIRKIRNGYNPTVSGDIVIEIARGWQLLNEETQETFISRASYIPFPIIFYGAGVKPQRITESVSVDRIAPTIAKTIHIRAPNACDAAPLF